VLVSGSRWTIVRPRIDLDRFVAADRIEERLSGCAGGTSS